MPKIKPLSDFNRNQSSMIEELQESKQPIYLTRNGSAAIVVMDADAFDREMSFRSSVYANEMRVYEGLMKGYADYQAGEVTDSSEAETVIRVAKGWS